MEKVLLSELDVFARNVLEKVRSLDFLRLSSGQVARDKSPERAFVIALSGDLGAGKTTFTQALARELGVLDVVQSPTYVLMKSYPINFSHFKKLIHIDAYRLNEPEEFKTLKPEEFLNDPKNVIVIEWPEKLGDLLPKPDLTLNFSSEDASEGERCIEIK